MGRAADQFAEKQDVFGVEIAVGQVLRRIARSVVPERVVVRAERLRTFRGLWVAQDFRARDFDSFPFLFDFFRLQTKPAGFENMRSVFADLRRGRLRSAAADGSEYDGHKKGCPYRATRHNKENNNLVSSRLLIGWGPKRVVARRKPPAAGLAACRRRNADGMYGSHKTKKGAQLRTIHPPVTGSIECHSRDCSPTALRIPFFCGGPTEHHNNRFTNI